MEFKITAPPCSLPCITFLVLWTLLEQVDSLILDYLTILLSDCNPSGQIHWKTGSIDLPRHPPICKRWLSLTGDRTGWRFCERKRIREVSRPENLSWGSLIMGNPFIKGSQTQSNSTKQEHQTTRIKFKVLSLTNTLKTNHLLKNGKSKSNCRRTPPKLIKWYRSILTLEFSNIICPGHPHNMHHLPSSPSHVRLLRPSFGGQEQRICAHQGLERPITWSQEAQVCTMGLQGQTTSGWPQTSPRMRWDRIVP